MNRRRKKLPWGRISGVLMGVFVTLACVVQQVDPIVIVQRATLSVVITGTVVRCANIMLQQSKSKRRRPIAAAINSAKPMNQT